MPKDQVQHSQAAIAVFAVLDAIATTRGLSAVLGFGSKEFELLIDAAADAEGFCLSADEQRLDYFAAYIERRGLQRTQSCT
ncbi:MAG TPA: hypothetical protein VGE60_00815 [Telluria sp.]